jgi:hypothetical protein
MFQRKAKLGALSTFIDDLAKALSLAGMKTSRNGGSLTVRHPKMITHVEVVSPGTRETAEALFEGVVQIKTEVPPDLAAYLSDGKTRCGSERIGYLGSLDSRQGTMVHRIGLDGFQRRELMGPRNLARPSKHNGRREIDPRRSRKDHKK